MRKRISSSPNDTITVGLYPRVSKTGNISSGSVRFCASIFISADIDKHDQNVCTPTKPVVETADHASHQPYTVSVTIFRAENLPVADFTSSDPFVVVSIDETTIGKTKTVSRNLNPVWGNNGEGEKFRFNSLHVNKILVFDLFDSNTATNNILLGTVRVPLNEQANSSADKSYLPTQYSITLAEKFKGKGKDHLAELSVSILVIKNDSLVRIIPDSSAGIGR